MPCHFWWNGAVWYVDDVMMLIWQNMGWEQISMCVTAVAVLNKCVGKELPSPLLQFEEKAGICIWQQVSNTQDFIINSANRALMIIRQQLSKGLK